MAGNEQVFDSIVDPIANKQVQSLTADLTALDLQAIDTAKSINQLNAATANSKTFADLTKNSAAVVAQQQKATDSIEKTRLAEIKLQQAREKAFDDYEKKLNKQTAANVKANSEYLKLTNSLKQAERAAQDAGAKFGATSPQFLAAAESVNKIRTEVEAIDKPLNVFANNTDRYAKGIATYVQKAFSGIRTLANIIPSFGVGTFFLDAGIALVFLADKLGIVKSKTQEVETAFDKARKSANDNAAEEISKADTLYAAATNLNIPMAERLKVVKELQEQYPAYFGNLSKEAILAGDAKTAYDNLTNSIVNKAVVAASQTLISDALKPLVEIISEQKRLQAEVDKNNADAQRRNPAKTTQFDVLGKDNKPVPGYKAIVVSGARNSVLQQFVDDETTAAKKLGQDGLQSVDQYKNKLVKKLKETQSAVQQIIQDLGINSLLDPDKETPDKKAKQPTINQKQIYSERIKQLKDQEDAILNDETKSYDQRLAAIRVYEIAAYDLTKKYSDKKVFTALESENNFSDVLKKSTADELKIRKDAQTELAKLINDGLIGQESAERESIEIIQKAGADKVLANEQNAADAIRALAEQYANGLITQKEYQKQLTAIQDEADIARLDQEIITAQAIIDVRKGLLAFGIGSAKELQSAEDKLANLKLQRTKAGTKAVLDGIKDETQARQELHQKEKELADESINLIKTAVDARYENQITALQAEADQVDVNAQKEKDQINNSLLSAKDKADKTAIIDARTAADKQKIANQEKQVKIKEAEFDKAISIASIIENTAVAISKTLAEGGALFGIPLVPVIAALGAVQIATVLAQPIPAFKDGGTTKGGVVLWGEAGTELATLPDGSQQVSKGATIQTFPANTKITPHLELMKMLTPDKINAVGGQEIGWKEVLSQLKRMDKPNRRPVTKININGDFDRYRKSYFK